MPTKCQYHGFSDCGYHCTEFDPDREKGRREIREKINPILEMYGTGYELSADGEILEKGETHLDALLTVSLPPVDRDNVETRVEAACTEFRRHRSSLSDRRQALRELADVLEFLRPQLRKVLTKADESDLFNLLNNFGIRHHTTEQKTDYDKPIFYSWMFYHHLAAIHAGIRLINPILNPHVRYFDGSRHGYLRCTVDRSAWQTDARVVDTIAVRDTPVYTSASFATEAGHPGVVPA